MTTLLPTSTVTGLPYGYGSLILNWTLPSPGNYTELVLLRSQLGPPVDIFSTDGVTVLDQIVANYDQTVAALAPEGWWKLADLVGTSSPVDSAGNFASSVEGTVTFGKTGPLTAIPSDTAALFDGSTGYIQMSGGTLSTSVITIAGWFNHNGNAWGSQEDIFFNNAGGFPQLGVKTSGTGVPFFQLDIGGSGVSIQGSVGLPTTGWHFLVGTYDGTTMRLYVDGVQVASQAESGSLTWGTIFDIGSDEGIGFFFNGSLAQVTIFNAPLSATEIASLYALASQSPVVDLQFTDTGLQPGQFYYYSLFVYDTDVSQYVLVGSFQGLAVTNYDFADRYLTLTPDWYVEQDALLFTPAFPNAGPLQRFFGLLGYETDWIRSEIESLYTFTNAEQIPGSLLTLLGANFGLQPEAQLGQRRMRDLIKNIVTLYKEKGTLKGVAAAASAFTGYGCIATIGKNLMIQLDDAAGDLSSGHWNSSGGSGGTASIVTAASQSVTPPHTAYQPIPSPALVPSGLTVEGYLPISNENVILFTATAGGNQIAQQIAGFATSVFSTLLIPVVSGKVYVFSAWFRPAAANPTTTRQWTMNIDWFSAAGYISTTSAMVNEASGQWAWGFVSGTAPANAIGMGLTVYTTLNVIGASEQHLMDAAQVEVNSHATPSPSSWQPPRDIQLNLLPVRQNLITNPQGLASPSGTAGWSFASTTMTPVTTAPAPLPAKVTSCFELIAQASFISEATPQPPSGFGSLMPGGGVFAGFSPSGGGGGGASNIDIVMSVPVNAGMLYTWSLYVLATSVARQVQMTTTFYNASQALISPAFTGSLSAPLVQGQRYTVLSVNVLPNSVAAGETFALATSALGSPSQILQAAVGAPQGATSIQVVPFVANTNYPINTLLQFQYVNWTETIGSWLRIYELSVLAPPTAITAVPEVVIVGCNQGEVHYMAAPLFEPAAALQMYFDANFSPNTDYIWEGTANQSISDYYPKLEAKLGRLVQVMPNFTPMGSTFSLITGAPALAAAGLSG